VLPAKQPVLVPVRKKKKRKKEEVGNYSDAAYIKWTLVNRVILNTYCSGFREDPDCCKLDRIKDLNYRYGRAKSVYFSAVGAVTFLPGCQMLGIVLRGCSLVG
jgi:hypothetical protein